MMHIFRVVLAFGLALLLGSCATESHVRQGPPLGVPRTASNPKTYVIVHGAWAGGWAFKEVDNLLRADGHKVYRPSLTGQGERVHLATPEINLSTHIQDIVNVILFEDLHEIILVGHSYGGMVVTGVADRVPERIKHLVYLDAFLPEDGESLNTSRGGKGGPPMRANADGFVTLRNYDPNKPPPREVPHPAKTLSEPISLNNPAAQKIPATYILTVDAGREPQTDGFFFFYERARKRGWTVLTMEGDHNVQWSHPKELVELLEKAP